MNKYILSVVALIILATPYTASASIIFDSSNAAENAGTVSDTVGSLTNGIVIGFSWTGGTCTPSATFGGTTMTAINTTITTNGNRLTEFYLLNPTSGSQSFTETGCTGAGIAVATYDGVNGINASTTQNSTSGTSFSNTITTIVDKSWVVTGAHAFGGGTNAASTNVAARTLKFSVSIGDNNADVTPAGNLSQTWTSNVTASGASPFIMGQVALSPAPPLVPNIQPPMIMTF